MVEKDWVLPAANQNFKFKCAIQEDQATTKKIKTSTSTPKKPARIAVELIPHSCHFKRSQTSKTTQASQ